MALLLSMRTVLPTASANPLPRWDLAAHLLNGWTTFDHLTHGRIARFAWDVWTQGYWPPGQSLFQVPFYVATGGRISGGLLSSTAAFGLTAAGAVALLGAIAGRRAWLPAAFTVALMCTSPFFLAYATVAMSEMVGAMAEMGVLVCFARFDERRDTSHARWLAISLSWLFFVKYNYFLLVALPLLLHLALEQLAATPARERWRPFRRVARWGASPAGALTIAYLLIVVVILSAGGFSLELAGQRLAFRTVGYSLHPLLYGWLAYAWYAHRRARSSSSGPVAADPRVRAFMLWLLLPITVWLASPFPNHIKDLVYLVFNIPMGPDSARLGLAAYLHAVRSEYFAHPAVFALAVGAFVVAAARYRRQPTIVRLLIITALLQFAMVTEHHTRDARFLLLAMPPFWIVGAHALGDWARRWRPGLAPAAAVVVLCLAVAGAFAVTSSAPFMHLAREHYVTSPALAEALASVRQMVPPDHDVAVIGRRDNVSPGLAKWQLGPPSGRSSFPAEISRETDLPLLDEAGLVVIVTPSEQSTEKAAHRIAQLVAAGRLAVRARFRVDDLGVSIEVFEHQARADD